MFGKLSGVLLAVLLVLVAGCATSGLAPGSASMGQTGPVAWEIVDVGLLDSSDGQRMRWSYVVVLKETAGSTIQFERVQRAARTTRIEMIGGTPQVRSFTRTLAARAEIRYPVSESWGWAGGHNVFGGAATINPLTVEYVFIGRDAKAQPITVPVRVHLDRGLGKRVKAMPTRGPLPPSTSLASEGLDRVAGTWRGAYRMDGSDFDIPFVVEIRPTGAVEGAENDPVTHRFQGRVSVREGKLAYSQGRDAGDLTLHESGGKRVLAGHISGPREAQTGPASRVGYVVRLEWQAP